MEMNQHAAQTQSLSPDYRPWLATALGGVAIGGMVTSAGGALLLTPGGTLGSVDLAFALVVPGILLLLVATFVAYRRGLCGEQNDCDLYGRHITALTFVLLFVGLCNAVGTSVMALDGGFEITTEVLLERAAAAELVKSSAEKARLAQADVVQSGRTHARALAEQKRTCPEHGSESAEPSSGACQLSKDKAQAAGIAAMVAKDAWQDAQDELVRAKEAQKLNCSACRQALFFLLALSTVMSLFGALFYVVNSVRMKRPGLPGEPADGSGDGGTTTSTPGGKSSAEGEPFDAHAFWGGAFFRVGEAVLFTFAFFWLLWTSKMHDVIIWLPVLALFLGMFVRAGEAIVFRLGQRLLSAAEELLPFSPAMMQGATTGRGSAQSPASRESRDREQGTNGAGRPSVTNGPSAGGG